MKKERDVAENNTSIIQKATPRMVKNYSRHIPAETLSRLFAAFLKNPVKADIAALNEVIDIATKLKEKIESIE